MWALLGGNIIMEYTTNNNGTAHTNRVVSVLLLSSEILWEAPQNRNIYYTPHQSSINIFLSRENNSSVRSNEIELKVWEEFAKN